MSASRGQPIAAAPAAPSAAIAHVGWGLVRARPHAAVVLRFSRALWIEPIGAFTLGDLGRAMVHATRYFGGSPRRWVFEQPDLCVARSVGETWHFAPQLCALAWRCSATLAVCPWACPGLCEAALRSLSTSSCARVPGRRRAAPVTLRRLAAWLDQTARRTSHPYQPDRTVAQLLAEERSFFGLVPDELEALFDGEDDVTRDA